MITIITEQINDDDDDDDDDNAFLREQVIQTVIRILN